jgi:hypothetical protein
MAPKTIDDIITSIQQSAARHDADNARFLSYLIELIEILHELEKRLKHSHGQVPTDCT